MLYDYTPFSLDSSKDPFDPGNFGYVYVKLGPDITLREALLEFVFLLFVPSLIAPPPESIEGLNG